MSAIYDFAGTSRQAHHALSERLQEMEDQFLMLSVMLHTEREKHPSMSLKKLYTKLNPGFIGRDAFVDFGMENGFEPIFPFKKPCLTRSSNKKAYPNLLHDLKIYDINQVWVSDITYFKVSGKWCYITFIEDLYSRRIIGFHAAQNLFAKANLMALQMALDTRKQYDFGNRLIHHSDRGTQYRSDEYTTKLTGHNIDISMAYSCFDNAYMESTNNIVKNEYLVHRSIKTISNLTDYLCQDVGYYNNERPHGSLKGMTPCEFERYILNIPLFQRTPLPIFTDKIKKHKLLIIEPDNQQLRLQFPGF